MSSNVGNVTGSGATQQYYDNLKTKKPQTEQPKPPANDPVDTYTPSTKSNSGVYSKDSAAIAKMWDEAHSATAALRNLVSSMLGTNQAGEGTGQAFWAVKANPEQYGMEVDEETRAEAESMISEDGYYGVKQTTSRIMDFAKALAGGKTDEKTIENLRDGAQKGFDDVAKMYGGFDKLPEVTKKTYEAVMKEFDDWKAGIAAAEQ